MSRSCLFAAYLRPNLAKVNQKHNEKISNHSSIRMKWWYADQSKCFPINQVMILSLNLEDGWLRSFHGIWDLQKIPVKHPYLSFSHHSRQKGARAHLSPWESPSFPVNQLTKNQIVRPPKRHQYDVTWLTKPVVIGQFLITCLDAVMRKRHVKLSVSFVLCVFELQSCLWRYVVVIRVR